MRHRKGFKQLSRKTGHRKAMMANMAASLIKHKRITTTTAKAKALRGYIEPLITKSKDDTTHSRRVVFRYLQDKDAVSELFREVSPKILDRPGGYTRILKLDNREGDNAEMAMIELVDFNENLLSETSTKAAGSRRRRRGGAKKKDEPNAPAAIAGTLKETATGTSEDQSAEQEKEPENLVEVTEELTEKEPVSEAIAENEEGIEEPVADSAEAESTEEEKQEENESEEKKDS